MTGCRGDRVRETEGGRRETEGEGVEGVEEFEDPAAKPAPVATATQPSVAAATPSALELESLPPRRRAVVIKYFQTLRSSATAPASEGTNRDD